MDTSNEEWDVIVVGAGIIGTCSAYNLVKRGLKTLLLEQFQLPHTRGSSHGKSRLIRQTFPREPYVTMMPEAVHMWKQLEKEGGKQLMQETGFLLLEDKAGTEIPETIACMDKHRLPYECLSHQDMCRRYPQIIIPSNERGLLDPSAGLLIPDTCLTVIQKLFEQYNGVIRDGETVKSIKFGNPVSVETSKGKYLTKKLVLNPGPWAKELLESIGLSLPLKTMPGLSSFLQEKVPGSHSVQQKFPVVISTTHDENSYRHFVMFPSYEYPGFIKLLTRGEPAPFYAPPERRDEAGHQLMIDKVSDFVKTHLPGIKQKPSIVEPCMYTLTPDLNFVIDFHPECDNIIIGVGFSGSGFKLAPLVGKLITEMVTGQTLSYDISAFRISRFKNSKL